MNAVKKPFHQKNKTFSLYYRKKCAKNTLKYLKNCLTNN
jgi:hypothetical protein